uniref:Uncharacterized protein n=1 Tax=viral metagenome TaxID=1070528 RepID=A0A6M3LBK6_9ZZZZ
MKASVKVMRSYDYCHFEICLGDDDMPIQLVDDIRKEAARLADRAVIQYKQAKKHYQNVLNRGCRIKEYRKEAEEILKISEPDRTPRQKAQLKALADYEFMLLMRYDYQDDWEDRWDQEEYDDPDGCDIPF